LDLNVVSLEMILDSGIDLIEKGIGGGCFPSPMVCLEERGRFIFL